MGMITKKPLQLLMKLSEGVTPSKRGVIVSIISCFLALMVLITSTFCWFSLRPSDGNLTGKLVTDNGLRVDDLGHDPQTIAERSCLVPASSVDGRNLFFPSDGSDFSFSTTSITYRSANAGDKNFSYLQYDFSLMAEANYTSIFIDLEKTHIMFEGWNDENKTVEQKNDLINKSKAIRSALFYDGIEDNKPILFNSTGKSRVTQAVERVDRTDGACLSTARQTSVPFRDYSYGKKQIAVLDQGDKRLFSLIVWIEGTDELCTNDLIDKKIDLSIGFTTSWDNKAKIIFKDGTSSASSHPLKNILDNSSDTLYLIYNDEAHKISNYRFPMYYLGVDSAGKDQWYCNIPDNAVHDITFIIYSVSNGTETVLSDSSSNAYKWNYATDDPAKNRGDSTIYIHDRVDGSNAWMVGHWYDGDIEDKGSGHDSGGIIDDEDW